MDDIHKHFRDVGSFIDFVDKAPSPWRGSLSSRKVGNADWAGTKTWEEAVQYARYGWPDGRKYLVENVELASRIHRYAVAPNFSYDIGGSYPDVPRYVGGDHMHMVDEQHQHKASAPVIYIVAQVGSNEVVSGKQKINWGAAVVSWIDKLETFGYTVDLTWASGTRYNYGRVPEIMFSCELKPAGSPLDLDRLAFWIGNPGSLRRIDFSAMERLDIERWYGINYGGAMSKSEQYEKYFPDNCLILNGSSGAHSVQDALERIGWDIEKHFENLGVDFSPLAA